MIAVFFAPFTMRTMFVRFLTWKINRFSQVITICTTLIKKLKLLLQIVSTDIKKNVYSIIILFIFKICRNKFEMTRYQATYLSLIFFFFWENKCEAMNLETVGYSKICSLCGILPQVRGISLYTDAHGLKIQGSGYLMFFPKLLVEGLWCSEKLQVGSFSLFVFLHFYLVFLKVFPRGSFFIPPRLTLPPLCIYESVGQWILSLDFWQFFSKDFQSIKENSSCLKDGWITVILWRLLVSV